MCRLLLLTVLALGATGAQAENSLFYLGAGVARNSVSDITLPPSGGSVDLKNTSWKAFAGAHLVNWLAVEVDYYSDFGSGSNADAEGAGLYINSHSAIAGYVVGFLPIPLPMLEVFGKAGAAGWKYDGQFLAPTLGSYSRSSNESGFAWGIGVQAHISMFGARVEYEQFSIPNNNGAKIASLSVLLNF